MNNNKKNLIIYGSVLFLSFAAGIFFIDIKDYEYGQKFLNMSTPEKTYIKQCPYGGSELFNKSTEIVCGSINPLKYNASEENGDIDLEINLFD